MAGDVDLAQVELLATLLLQAGEAALPRHPLLPGLLCRGRLDSGEAWRAHGVAAGVLPGESGGERRWHDRRHGVGARGGDGERRELLRPGHVPSARRMHVARRRRGRRGERLAAHDHAALAAALLEGERAGGAWVHGVAAVRGWRREGLVGHPGCGGGGAHLLATGGELVAGVGAGAGELRVRRRGAVVSRRAGALLLEVVVLHPGEDELEQLHGALAPAAEPRGRRLDGGSAEADAAEVVGGDVLTVAREPLHEERRQVVGRITPLHACVAGVVSSPGRLHHRLRIAVAGTVVRLMRLPGHGVLYHHANVVREQRLLGLPRDGQRREVEELVYVGELTKPVRRRGRLGRLTAATRSRRGGESAGRVRRRRRREG